MVTHHPFLPKISNILRDHHHILEQPTKLKDIFRSHPRIEFTRPRNLRNLLVHAGLKDLSMNHQATKCGNTCCNTCPVLITSGHFTSKSTNITYKIKHYCNCKSHNMIYIYLIECQMCSVQYVGETDKCFHERMNSHRADILHGRLDGKLSQDISTQWDIPSTT